MPFTLPSGPAALATYRRSYKRILGISEFSAQQAAHLIPAASKSASSGPNITEFPERMETG